MSVQTEAIFYPDSNICPMCGKNFDSADDYRKHRDSELGISNEEGLASVSGPPADSNMAIVDDEPFVLPKGVTSNENYIQDQFGTYYRPIYVGEAHEVTDDDLIFEGKYYTSEGVGNCEYCSGAGKVTVEGLGVKDCPDCDGTGDVQAQPMQPQQPQGQAGPQFGSPEIPDLQSQVPQQQAELQQQMQSQMQQPQTQLPTPQIPPQQPQGQQPVSQPQEQTPQPPKKENPKKAGESLKSCECKKRAHETSVKNYKEFVATKLEVLKKHAKAGEAVNLMYGKPTISQDGRKIKGTLAYAGVSLNDRIYLPEELAKGDGLTLPLLLNHSSTIGAERELHRLDDEMLEHLYNEKDYQVGEVTLTWDPKKLTLYYEGVVNNEFFQKEIDDMDMAVSLGIFYDSDSPKVCDENCYTLIKGAEFREVSLVYHAGFPIATIEAVEAELKANAIKHMSTEDHTEILNQLKKNEKKEQAKGEDEKEDIALVDAAIKDEKKDEAKEELDVIAPDQTIDATPKPKNTKPFIDPDQPLDQPIIGESFFAPHDFSIRGVHGITISNSNGVQKYTLDPANEFENNWVHLHVIPKGATAFGESLQLQPKMTTPKEVTKEIEKKPDIKIEDSGKDIIKDL